MGPFYFADARKAIEAAFKESGKKLDAGKACIRFKGVEALNLTVLGKYIKMNSVQKFLSGLLLLTRVRM